MANDNEKKRHNNVTEGGQPVKTAEANGQKLKDTQKTAGSPPWPYITVGIVLTIVMLAVAITSWAWVNTAMHHGDDRHWSSERGSQDGRLDERRGSEGPGWFFGSHDDFFDGMFDDVASGVVTKIDGDTVTLAGQGREVAVLMSDDTIVSGDETSLSVNDTVVVVGEKDGDTITAMRVIVRNGSGIDHWFERGGVRPDA